MVKDPFQFIKAGLYIFFLTVLFLFSAALSAQEADSSVSVGVFLKDDKSKEAVQFAHVINLRSERGGITDMDGFIRITAWKRDMLRISAIGYFDHYIFIPDSAREYYTIQLPMKQKIYLLNEVRVNTLGNYDQFRRKFIGTELPDKEARELQKIYRKMGRDTALKYQKIKTGIPLSFPSPEQRIEARRRELELQLKEQRMMNEKFSPEVVSRLTGLKGEELYRFMQFCNFSKEFLLKNNQYDILLSTLFYYDQWRAMRNRSNNRPSGR